MKLVKFVPVVLILVFSSGCAMRWHPVIDSAHDDSPTEQSQSDLRIAENCFDHAMHADSLESCQGAYQTVLNSNPGDYTALTKLSTINILIGTAYTESSWSKSDHFRRAMTYAEQAMYTNPDFRAAVQSGTPLWEAVAVLGEAEVEAMFFWVTALQYEFKEGMSLPTKIVNIEWLQRALVVLDRIKEVAPDFGGGGVEFAKAICYYALPERYGGSKKMGDAMMFAAVEGNNDWLLPRWARGKYYYVITDQPEKSRQELGWVAQQNPDDYHDPYPWRLHFIESSAELLK